MRACFALRTDMFKPSPIFRAVKEARALAAAGWACSASCWIKGAPVLPARETVDEVEIHRIRYDPPAQRLAFIPARYLGLRRVSKAMAAEIAAIEPDVVIAHDLEVLGAGVRAAQSRHVPVLYDAHEDWPAMVGETSRLEGWLASSLERRLCQLVDAVVTPSDSIRDKYRRMGLRAETLYNSPYREEVDPPPDPVTVQRTRNELGLSGRFVLGYSGTLAPHRGLETTIDALTHLPDDVFFLVVGGPDDEQRRLETLARNRGVDRRIRLVGRVPRTEVPRFTATFDLAVVLLPPVSANYLQALPNKVFDYLAAGIPILASDLPELRRFVELDVRCGVVVPPNPASVVSAVTSLRAAPDRLKQLGTSGRTAFVERLSWDHQAAKFLTLLREIGVPIGSGAGTK